VKGTEICKNDCGVKLQNCLCYIDEDTTRIYDNNLLEQVKIIREEISRHMPQQKMELKK